MGGTRVQARKVRVGAKTRVFGLKQGQRRDVRGQRRDILERKVSNVATFQRVVKINVSTLISNVETFQRGAKSTSRR